MDTVQGMKVFVQVAQRSGFAAAARELRMSPAAVTKHVAAIEDRVGARLFDRTTRSVALTEAGRIYLERCLECLQSFEDADMSVRQLSMAPRGTLRITAPIDLAQVPVAVARFMKAHPAVTIDLRVSNRPVDLVDEGIDVAVRLGSPTLEGDFIARPLAPATACVVASPEYLRKHGAPRRPQDLARHRALIFVEPRPRLEWTFERRGRRVAVTFAAAMTSNHGTALVTAAAEGAGVLVVPSFLGGEHIADGRLVRLLEDWKIVAELRLYAVYPHRRFVSPNVTAFIETLRGTFAGGP